LEASSKVPKALGTAPPDTGTCLAAGTVSFLHKKSEQLIRYRAIKAALCTTTRTASPVAPASHRKLSKQLQQNFGI
jgi:hypothetical protein